MSENNIETNIGNNIGNNMGNKIDNKSDNKKSGRKNTAGEIIAKIVWIIGALFYGIYASSNFISIGSEAEDTADCLKSGIIHGLYFIAFVFGIFYLFNVLRKKAVFISSLIYVAAYVLGFIDQFTGGSRLAAEDITTNILKIVALILFVVFAGLLVKEKHGLCINCWFIPAAFFLFAGLLGSLWTEFVRPDGFLWDGFIFDFIMAVIVTLPVYTMSRVIKNRV